MHPLARSISSSGSASLLAVSVTAALPVALAVVLCACGGSVVFESSGTGGSGDGGAAASTSVVGPSSSSSSSPTTASPSSNVASTGSDGCPDSAPTACDGGMICLSQLDLCDGFPDCNDGTDELDCGSTCTPEDFVCADGTCIPGSWVCDAYDDCFGGEDEDPSLCGPPPPCDGDGVVCLDGSCIPEVWICDGEADCAGGEDEDVNVCNGEICSSGLVIDELTATYCLSTYCCRPVVECTSNGVEACIDCLDGGGGPLCDAALLCAASSCGL